jgi:NAD(P)-dependent dehydrogenase (short-subunit alcohol dehydrogenase family)
MSSNILITGGYTGVGLSIVKALLETAQPEKLLSILITSRSLARAQEAVKALEAEATFAEKFGQGHKVLPYQLDVDDDAAIELFAGRLEKEFGRLDVLINNAGMSLVPSHFPHAAQQWGSRRPSSFPILPGH